MRFFYVSFVVLFLMSFKSFSADFNINGDWKVNRSQLPHTFESSTSTGGSLTLPSGFSISVGESTASKDVGDIAGSYVRSFLRSNTESFDLNEYFSVNLASKQSSLSIKQIIIGGEIKNGSIRNGVYLQAPFDYELRSSADNYASVLESGSHPKGWMNFNFEFANPISVKSKSGKANIEFRLYLKTTTLAEKPHIHSLDLRAFHIKGSYE